MISHAFTLILALKAVQASDTTGNTQRVNITLGFVSYYCSIRNTEYNSSLVSNYTTNFDPILVNIEDNSGVAYYDDLGMLAAVERVNNDPTILPGVHVNIKRFSDCGTYDPNAAADYAGDSAGFASAVTAWDIAEVHKDVVGVISNEYSTVTAGIAEILSASMIPMCGTCAGSPRMSNKETYPYYWRMLSADYSRQMLLILEKWNVKRVGIIYQDDSEIGLQLWKAMKREFAQVAISVVATVKLSRNFDKAAANYTTQALQSSDCRYIIISGTGAFVASILASQSTLIGSKWVWMSYNFPQANGDPTQLYGPDFYSYLRGFIIVGDIKTTPNELYHQLNNMAGSILAHDSFVENCVCEAYDCTMMMLLGFDKLLLQNNSWTAQDLSERTLNQHLNYTFFKNLGYHGLTSNPMALDDFGNLKLAASYLALNGDYYNTTCFAQSDAALETIVEYNSSLPIFFDGSAIPPPDGPPPLLELSYIVSSIQGTVIIAASMLGLALALVAISVTLIYGLKKATYHSESWQMSFQLCLGSIINYSYILLFLNQPSLADCMLQWPLFLFGHSLIVIPVTVNAFFTAYIFLSGAVYKNQKTLKKIQRSFEIGKLCLTLLFLMLSISWGLVSKMLVIKVQNDTASTFKSCQFENVQSFQIANLLLYTILCMAYVVGVYLQYHIQLPDEDITTAHTITAAVLMAEIAVIQILLGEPKAFSTNFKLCMCIWIANTVIILAFVGPITWGLLLKASSKENNRPQSQRNGQSVSRESREKKMLFIAPSPVAITRSLVLSVPHAVKCKYQYQQLQLTSRFMIWRQKHANSLYWTKWLVGVASVHIINRSMQAMNGQKCWFSMMTFESALCIPIDPIDIASIKGGRVTLNSLDAIKSISVEIEFQDFSECETFVMEIQTALCQIGFPVEYNEK